MKKNLLFMVLLVQVIHSYSQTPELNLKKYWNYRDRLKSKFMVSTNKHFSGVNIPANLYNPTSYGDTHNTLRWGDATSYLGHYIGVLATEYSLLKTYNQDCTGTVNELMCTLSTIQRLDHTAESYYGGACSAYYTNGFRRYPYNDACFNGFFVRDDIPTNFADFWKKYGYPAFDSIKNIQSDSQNPEANAMSQDQVWNLMFGLALVKKLVDCPDTFLDGDGEYVTLKKWAQKITYRILKYMQSSEDLGKTWVPCNLFDGCWPGHWVNVILPGWTINNPITGKTVSRGGGTGEIILNGYLFAEAGNWITDQQFGDLHYTKAYEPNIVSPLPFGYKMTEILRAFYPSGSYPEPKYYNDNAKLTLSSIAKIDWADNVENLLAFTNEASFYYNGLSLPDNTNDRQLFAFEHFPMYHVVLHDEIPNFYYFDYYMSFVENLLNLAPMNGTYRYLYDSNDDGINDVDEYPNKEWATDNRTTKPIGLSLRDGESCGEYNGLDYMILYNLYRITYEKTYENSRTISTTFPTPYKSFCLGTPLGDSINQTMLNISTLQNIEANNIIEANGKITYKASNKITLLPGFTVKEGAIFQAYCEENVDYKKSLNKGLFLVNTTPTSYTKEDEYLVEKNEGITIRVYPNPVKDRLFFNISSHSNEPLKIEIADAMGKTILSMLVADNDTKGIDISSFSSGFYVIKMSNSQVMKSFKIVKLNK